MKGFIEEYGEFTVLTLFCTPVLIGLIFLTKVVLQYM